MDNLLDFSNTNMFDHRYYKEQLKANMSSTKQTKYFSSFLYKKNPIYSQDNYISNVIYFFKFL
jgi:hypothetical protein